MHLTVSVKLQIQELKMTNADGNYDVLAVKEFANTEAGTLTDSGAADVACDARIKVQFNGTTYWIPLFDTAP